VSDVQVGCDPFVETNGRGHARIGETLAQALRLTEEALSEVALIAVAEIRSGLEGSSHVEAAEREMRGALRQLVLAERELQTRRDPSGDLVRRVEVSANGSASRAREGTAG
jgi:hypothetical protein